MAATGLSCLFRTYEVPSAHPSFVPEVRNCGTIVRGLAEAKGKWAQRLCTAFVEATPVRSQPRPTLLRPPLPRNANGYVPSPALRLPLPLPPKCEIGAPNCSEMDGIGVYHRKRPGADMPKTSTENGLPPPPLQTSPSPAAGGGAYRSTLSPPPPPLVCLAVPILELLYCKTGLAVGVTVSLESG